MGGQLASYLRYLTFRYIAEMYRKLKLVKRSKINDTLRFHLLACLLALSLGSIERLELRCSSVLLNYCESWSNIILRTQKALNKANNWRLGTELGMSF
ncbi:hypothetical protein M430DRAFT_152474 [Amorphotheca resinae ATCC 22711]|uniref:Uncharacterized protein n=1 Tax=Amorphotheca resinae ATCC 22711 TaxID=857342 RepID=A0A2T3BD89_AMORE|nr:hypothetical protein M430DRAFT_152474 [Amorphotheca resinae ATCC 22711]PSS27303.1 hypothetical protein M430DRAFT_152474 [Amorphotheca resinae ATCC 22711]